MIDKITILIVEKDDGERDALVQLLRDEGYKVLATADINGANETLASVTDADAVDMVISEIGVGRANAAVLLKHWRSRLPHIRFVIVTAHGDIDSAIHAMKLGADDYLSKPVNPDELLILIEKSLESRRRDEQLQQLRQRLDKRLGFESVVGQSKAILEVIERARRAAVSDCAVLVTGEFGTGKRLFAEAIHQNGPRRDGPFVAVSVAALPGHLMASELFGHDHGAFSQPTDSGIGRLIAAHHGTLFIDEVSALTMESQAALCPILEHHQTTCVAGGEGRDTDVRLIAASSRCLEEMVQRNTFLAELYDRLNVVKLPLPPLRSRREDIPLLVQHFLKQHCDAKHVEPFQLDPKLREFLENHDWPGNVRQLRNCLESMVVSARNKTLTVDDLPAAMEDSSSTPKQFRIPANITLDELEKAAVTQALERHEGNRTHTAKSLKISVRTLQRKLKAWSLESHSAR